MSVDDVDGLGYAEPVRSDLTKATKTIKLNIFELFRKEMLSLTHGIDLSQVKANATTGEVVFDDPLLPSIPEKRLLLVAADGPADDEWLMGWCFTRAKLVSMPTIGLKATDPITGDLEFKAFADEAAGTACRNYYGGSAMLKHRDITGFSV